VKLTAAALIASVFSAGQGTASAEILWKGNFETKDLTRWSRALNPVTGSRQNITVVDSPALPSGYAAQITVHPDDIFSNGHNRVELNYEGKRTGEGQTTFFSWRFRLATNPEVHEDIAYWETQGPDYRQSMAFYVDPGRDGARIGFRTNLPAAKEHWNGTVSAGEWHQIAMKIVWARTAGNGRVSVWFDGQPVVEEAAAPTKPNGADLFIQMGFHRDRSQAAVETIYIGDAIEGTSPEDVVDAEPATSHRSKQSSN